MIEIDDADVLPEHRANVARFLQLILETTKLKSRYVVQSLQNKPYLERLVLHRDGEHGAGTYLHVIWESDTDRDPHDHPFNFESTIVYGGYREDAFTLRCPGRCNGKWMAIDEHNVCTGCWKPAVLDNRVTREFKAGDVNKKVAPELHRLTLLEVPTVTLVHRGPKVRDWGFQTPEGWQASKDWIAENKPDASTEVE